MPRITGCVESNRYVETDSEFLRRMERRLTVLSRDMFEADSGIEEIDLFRLSVLADRLAEDSWEDSWARLP